MHRVPFTGIRGLRELVERKYIEVLKEYVAKLNEYVYGEEVLASGDSLKNLTKSLG